MRLRGEMRLLNVIPIPVLTGLVGFLDGLEEGTPVGLEVGWAEGAEVVGCAL